MQRWNRQTLDLFASSALIGGPGADGGAKSGREEDGGQWEGEVRGEHVVVERGGRKEPLRGFEGVQYLKGGGGQPDWASLGGFLACHDAWLTVGSVGQSYQAVTNLPNISSLSYLREYRILPVANSTSSNFIFTVVAQYCKAANMESDARKKPATPPPSLPHSPELMVRMPADEAEPGTLYKLFMTPIYFVSFLVSLTLVDIHYTQLRMHTHAESRSRLPSWLHDILYSRYSYQDSQWKPSDVTEPWHYHSKQKKLMRMEAEDAFRLRGTVIAGLAGLAVAAAAGTTAALYSLKVLLSWLLG
ncbi:hypothetical protein ISF_04786 [Cordyceps fumosorosea ARSEF 2679]|uniref:Uncharacterized protein n=1 Tax=Cordyceps fumosorosea (strain ARSEF 2679) TaxID=1081104 RepID=A0A167WQB0_CORFA|nr:hypothetical protein ISF_04786 [Cordyceps fumosorosea ARSEF 2679]OAA64077.1 hypothetical protein ISF_04786 [Cordyceps fumosorosea ARSEF 2679]